MKPIRVRWMIRDDYPEVFAIENKSFKAPWLKKDFICCFRKLNCIGMVAEYHNQVVGYIAYALYKHRIHLVKFAVHPKYRRLGVGTQMVTKLISKLSANRRNRITLAVRETNLPAQLFFSNCGFRAICILREFYEDTPEDAYRMQYVLKVETYPPIFKGKNRIAGLHIAAMLEYLGE